MILSLNNCGGNLTYDCQNIIFTHQQVIFSIKFDFCAAVFAVKDFVAHFYFQLDRLAVIANFTFTYSFYSALNGLFLGRIGDDDSPFSNLFFQNGLNQNTVMQWLDFHIGSLKKCYTQIKF